VGDGDGEAGRDGMALAGRQRQALGRDDVEAGGVLGGISGDRVRKLMKNPLFNRTNPNRVRALVGTFAFTNPTGFGRADGEGYRFLAREILDIDQRNPQLAARILTSMRSWRSLEPVRAGLARAALMQIEQAPALSTDVRDIVERTLKGLFACPMHHAIQPALETGRQKNQHV
jgi:aminopeptidase N